MATRSIELAGEINTQLPPCVAERLALALDNYACKRLNGSRILVLGLASKKNVDDLRESPSVVLIEILKKRCGEVDYHDSFIAEIMRTREHPGLAGMRSVAWEEGAIASYDAVLIATDHDDMDYRGLVRAARLVVGTRNACARAGAAGPNVVKS